MQRRFRIALTLHPWDIAGRLMKRILLAFGLLALSPLARAESVTPADIAAGKLVPGSISPDGKICLLEVFHDRTTMNSVIFATADRQQNLGHLGIHTEWSTDRPHKGRTTVLWSPDGTRVAIHDSIPKHSSPEIYRLVEGRIERVPLPDLLPGLCRDWKVAAKSLASSGQLPVRWSGETLTLTVSAKLEKGGKRTTNRQLTVPATGAAVIVAGDAK